MKTVGVAVLAAAALGGAALVACESAKKASPGDGDAGAPVKLADGGTATRADFLRAFGACALAGAREFDGAAATFEAATAAYAAAPGPDTRGAAQDAWRAAMAVWERMELFQFGPSATKASPGGQDLRDQIYAWPLGGRCLVEQLLVSRGYDQPTFAAGLVNTRGLLAAEYLLFYGGTDNACAATATINASGQWAQIGADLEPRKAAYARAAGKDVRAQAARLLAAWAPDGGNFVEELATAGAGSKTYASGQLAFNAVSDALFYLEVETKDMKLAHPSGVSKCAAAACPEALESQWAGASKAHVRQNLAGFRKLFAGCGDGGAGLGLDDLLAGLGQGELAARMTADLDAAERALDAIPEVDLAPALTAHNAEVRALHAAVKKITDAMRTELVSILDLEPPKRIEGDND